MAGMEDVDRKRVAKQLPELEQTRYWMRFLSRVIAQMGNKADKQIRPGAKPDEAQLRRLFEKWGKAWTEGTNQPLSVSRQGVTWPSKQNVLKLTPKSRTGAELHAFAAALLAIDRRISNKSLIYYLQHAQSTSTHLASKSKLPKKSAAQAA